MKTPQYHGPIVAPTIDTGSIFQVLVSLNDGEWTGTLGDFMESNEDVFEADLELEGAIIEAIACRRTYHGGGGAAAAWTLCRVPV